MRVGVTNSGVAMGWTIGGERFSNSRAKDNGPKAPRFKPVLLINAGLITVVAEARQSLVFTGLTSRRLRVRSVRP